MKTNTKNNAEVVYCTLNSSTIRNCPISCWRHLLAMSGHTRLLNESRHDSLHGRTAAAFACTFKVARCIGVHIRLGALIKIGMLPMIPHLNWHAAFESISTPHVLCVDT